MLGKKQSGFRLLIPRPALPLQARLVAEKFSTDAKLFIEQIKEFNIEVVLVSLLIWMGPQAHDAISIRDCTCIPSFP